MTLRGIKQEHKLVQLLIYGIAKVKKTWWAAGAATAGYNVILLNGEKGGYEIINHVLSTQEQSFITVIDAVDKFHDATFIKTLAMLAKGQDVVWDIDKRMPAEGSCDLEHEHFVLNLSKLTPNDVVILDSMTALAHSSTLQVAKEQGIDLSDAKKPQWDYFGYQARIMDWLIGQFRAFPCHLIVIGHEVTYEKRKPDPNDRTGKREVIDWVRRQPASCSNPHGMKLAKEFADILYFYRISGETIKIDTRGEKDRDGGCRNLEPRLYDWAINSNKDNELSFDKVAHLVGATPSKDNPETPGLKYFPAGENPRGEMRVKNPLLAGAAIEVKSGGKVKLAGMVKQGDK